MAASPGNSPVRILHLSDIHFRAGKAWDSDPVLPALSGFIADEVEAGLVPDLVVITGDLAFGGKKAEYDLAQAWLERELWPALSRHAPDPLPRDRLFLVPGNHDADRSKVNTLATIAQNGLLANRDQDQIASVLKDRGQRSALMKRHDAYIKFYARWLGVAQPLPWWQRRIEIRGQRLHVAGLDSAWMACGDTDRGRLLLGRWQINQTVVAKGSDEVQWRLALLHHPWDYLAEFDSHEARQTIHLHRDLLLRGHLHEGEASFVRPADPQRACVELAAGCVYDGSTYPNAFQWIELHARSNEAPKRPKRVRVLFRAWVKGTWQVDRNQPGCKTGVAEFPLERSAAIKPNTATPRAPVIPAAYLAWLRERYTDFDLLGKGLKQSQAITLSQVYVPAVTVPATPSGPVPAAEAGLDDPSRGERAPPTLLLDRVAAQSLYCPAPAGAGKTTFCRWAVLQAIADGSLVHPVPPPEGFEEAIPAGLRGRLPLLVPLWDLWPSMDCGHGHSAWHRPQLEQALAQWVDRIQADGLTGDLLRAHLAAGSAFLLLDGIDEVPVCETRNGKAIYPRSLLLSGLTSALPAWEKTGNRTLLTSRPYGLDDQELDRLKLARAPLEPLPEELQKLFVTRWFHTLSKPGLAPELMRSLQDLDLARLTENPLLLTALCVIYHDGGRLPGDLWGLYAGMCDNVLHNRYLDKIGERPLALARLEAIAHGMHTGEGLGEQRRTPQRFATADEIERLLRLFADLDGRYEEGQVGPVAWREDLLTKSGLLLLQDQGKAAFYHLSIQEFLAAERIARNRRSDTDLMDLFRTRWDVPEWRLTLLFLFAGIAFHHCSSPAGALDLLTRLGQELDRERVRANPAEALFVSDALELCVAKKSVPPELAASFRQTCLDAIADAIEVKARQTLGLCLGRLGDPRIPDLRDPAAYIEVPAGAYVYGDKNEKIRIEAPFLLGRFLVTNGQYRAFMDDGGYRDRAWWSEEGWAWLQKRGVAEPSAWQDRGWNVPNQPVVGVSFWEAEACCCWAGGRLPTEQEWEAAARGPEGDQYPWGNDWEDGICNSHTTGLGVTSPVGLFPRSRQARLGFEDLAGNVWEWCGSLWDKPGAGAQRVLRGGAFDGPAEVLRASDRDWVAPRNRNRFSGFRCVVAPPRQP